MREAGWEGRQEKRTWPRCVKWTGHAWEASPAPGPASRAEKQDTAEREGPLSPSTRASVVAKERGGPAEPPSEAGKQPHEDRWVLRISFPERKIQNVIFVTAVNFGIAS